MTSIEISDSLRKSIKSAFEQIGYSEEMFLSDVHFIGERGENFSADLVAYSSSLRRDIDTAVVSIKGTENVDSINYDKDISPFQSLATPIIILAEYRKVKNMDDTRIYIAGLGKDVKGNRVQNEKIIPFSRFKEYLKDNQEHFTPRRLERVKWYSEQLSLFDVSSDLMQKAFQIVTKELVERFEKGVRNVLRNNDPKYEKDIIKASIRILAARILRDRLRKDWPIASGADYFLRYARDFLKGYFDVPSAIAAKLDPLLSTYLHGAFDFSQISLEMVGKFYESAFVTKDIRDQMGIHYTKSLLARTLLSRMPIEEIHPDKRILGDPTCGSGSLLAAGYERLADATYSSLSDEDRHQKLINSICGNDKDGFAAEIARMTLMLFHPPHKNNWKVTDFDAEDLGFNDRWIKKTGIQPMIIVANPPFGEKGGGVQHPGVPRARNQSDRSEFFLNKCLEILPPEGLLGIILTETILDQERVKSTRQRILKDYQILEQWSVPSHWFSNVNRNAMAWVIRKKASSSMIYNILPLSEVPIPGSTVQYMDPIEINSQLPKEDLVPTTWNNILTAIEQSPHRIEDFYKIWSGFQPYNHSVKAVSSAKAHPWSGRAVHGTNPYTDFGDGKNGWLELNISNFPPKSPRSKLIKKHMDSNDPMIMLRANRNEPLSNYKWSSIALIDVPENNRAIVAPSENYLAAFSKSNNISDKQDDVYALWAILNHPIANLWFHERLRVTKITTKKFKKFPLPQKMKNESDVKLLASLARKLLSQMREATNRMYASNAISSSKIVQLFNLIDTLIFQMYGITEIERRQIEGWFDKEPRPGLEDFCQPKKTAIDAVRSQIDYKEAPWETTFETLEVDFQESLIRLAIDGLSNDKENGADEDGLWLKIIPQMPGWIMEKGVSGWIELTAYNAENLCRYPERHIVEFRLYKNAYMMQDEIDKYFLSSSNEEMEAIS
jgi:hypothetical protein